MDLYPPAPRSPITTAFGYAKRKVNAFRCTALILVAVVGGIIYTTTTAYRWFPAAREVYYTNQPFIGLWVPPPTQPHRPNRSAIITSVWSPNDTIPASVLGHSISRWTPAIYEEGGVTAERCGTVDMLAMYLPGAVDEESRRRLEQVGWKLVSVERVYGPKDTPEDRRFGYTKFRAFDFTEYGHILLLDSNTLVVSRDVYSIFDNDLDFAGVTEQYTDRPFHQPINSGVLYYRPSQEFARFAISKVNSTDYAHQEGEQSLIRTFMKHVTTHLPIEWNVGVWGKKAWRQEWPILKPRFKILHYSLVQTFIEDEDAHKGTIEEDEVSLWWRIRKEMEDLHVP